MTLIQTVIWTILQILVFALTPFPAYLIMRWLLLHGAIDILAYPDAGILIK